MFSKPLILAVLVSLSFNGLFGYLSYYFYGERVSALVLLDKATESNKSLNSSLEKKSSACLVTDAVVTEYQKEKQEIVGKKDSDLDAIDKLPPMPVPKTKTENVAKKATNVARGATQDEETDVVDIDSKLPADLVGLLSEVCLRAKGSACDDT